MARASAPVLEIWRCGRPNCGAHNVAASSYCCVCEAPKKGHPPLSHERILQPIDLEEFLRTNFENDAKRHQLEVHIIGNEIYLTVTPLFAEGTPAIYQVEHNATHPCDSLGRRGW